MKKDVTELKKIFFEILQNPDIVENGNIRETIFKKHKEDVFQPLICYSTT